MLKDGFIKQRTIHTVLLLGVLLDQLSTRIGLNVFNMVESNPITWTLIQNRSWFLLDTITLIGLIATTRILSQSEDKRLVFFSKVFPLTAGLFRLLSSTSNFSLILQSIAQT